LNNGGTGDSNLAAISFHCSGYYGAHMHLRADGYIGIGGWSASPWVWYIHLPSGTMTSTGPISGTIYYDFSNTAFYTDPASTSIINNAQITTLRVGTSASGTTGEIRATNNITAYYSDDRLKTRIQNIPNALEKLLSLNGFYFRPNQTAQDLGYADELQVGVSAQEVEAVLPEVVVPAPIDELYKTVRYEKLIPLLIEAIKEQQEAIKEQQDRINRLEGIIANGRMEN